MQDYGGHDYPEDGFYRMFIAQRVLMMLYRLGIKSVKDIDGFHILRLSPKDAELVCSIFPETKDE